MKYKLSIVIIAIVLILGGSIIENIYINKTFDEFENKLSHLMQQEEYDFGEIKAVSDWWDKKSDYLEIAISVVLLNEITVTLGELKGAVQNEDYDSASALLDRIYCYSVGIKDMYKLEIENIL